MFLSRISILSPKTQNCSLPWISVPHYIHKFLWSFWLMKWMGILNFEKMISLHDCELTVTFGIHKYDVNNGRTIVWYLPFSWVTKPLKETIFLIFCVSINVLKRGDSCQFLASKIYDKIWHFFNIFCNFCVLKILTYLQHYICPSSPSCSSLWNYHDILLILLLSSNL